MFLIDKSLAKPNVSKTIHFTELLDEQLTVLAKGEGISFNELVLRCCEYALKDSLYKIISRNNAKLLNDAYLSTLLLPKFVIIIRIEKQIIIVLFFIC